MLGAFAALITYPKLPSLEVLTDYRPKLPLRILSEDGKLIGEFGEERRSVVRFKDVPRPLVDAILAAEDERFYQHGGIDYAGVLRAMLANFVAGETRQGASTITMQVAKNFFLSSERTLTRKFNEALLSYKIESEQRPDPRAVHQPDLPWATQLRLRSSGPNLLRQRPQAAQPGRDSHARRTAQGPFYRQPHHQPPTRSGPHELRA
jgi:hypothetical protein